MRILLDTNILVMLAEGGQRLTKSQRHLLEDTNNNFAASAASLWEIAIKFRSGKLALSMPPDSLKASFAGFGIEILDISAEHAVSDPVLASDIRDPFDRLIVAIAELDDHVLMTTDRKLLDHPGAWRP